MRITRSASDPTVAHLSLKERWHGPDHGLISSWESGARLGKVDPDLAERARCGELMSLPWKGGIDKALKTPHKFGSLKYLAMWRGLRGEVLDLSLYGEVTLTCSRTNMKVTYTPDRTKYVEP